MKLHSKDITLCPPLSALRASEQVGGVAARPLSKPLYAPYSLSTGCSTAVLPDAVQLGATEAAAVWRLKVPKEPSAASPDDSAKQQKPPSRSLDTTAQLGQPCPTNLQKRARRKSLGEAVAERLLGGTPDSPLRFAYLRTLTCAGVLKQDGATLTAKYCKARWCPVCSAIRTAKLMVAYAPELLAWMEKAEPTFVTLSRPNVKGDRLNGEIRLLLADFVLLAKNIRRTDGIAFRAVRKLEVTHNREDNTYHPHLHLLTDSKAAGDAMVKRWLLAHPTASPDAQDCRPADSPMELFKYVTKLLVKGLDGKQTTPPAYALDTIFKALKGLRTIQPIGFKVAAAVVLAADETLQLDAATLSPISRPNPVRWEWMTELYDWVDKETGEILSDYSPKLTWVELLARIRSDGLG